MDETGRNRDSDDRVTIVETVIMTTDTMVETVTSGSLIQRD